MKTLTFDSTVLKTIVNMYVSNRSGDIVTSARLDHGHVDSDDFFKELDLNTGKYPLKDKPQLKYDILGSYMTRYGDFETIIYDHISKLGYKPMGEIKYSFQVPEYKLREVRSQRDFFCGRIDGKVTVSIDVKPKNIIKLISDLL